VAPFNATQPALSTGFRDGTGNDTTRKHDWWETNGYGPNFKGWTMGPAYWGKTFYMWPPDPRAPIADPGAAGYVPGDWRRRYFVNVGDFGGTNNGQPLTDNARLWNTVPNPWISNDPAFGNLPSYGRWISAGTRWQPNYTAIIKWINSGPRVFPPSLRSGRVLYYDAIPTSIPSSGGTEDQRFWRNYIDYVVCYAASDPQGTKTENNSQAGVNVATVVTANTVGTGSTDALRLTHGGQSYGDHIRVTPASRVVGQNGSDNSPGDDPYMSYHDNPIQPRARMWFGPLSMMNFITDSVGEAELMAGTTHQAQCWQVKAGAQSALEDIEKNHPNDLMALIYFSGSDSFLAYNEPRQVLSDQYNLMKKLLWYPFKINSVKPLADPAYTPALGTGYLGNDTDEIRPYTTSGGWNSANKDIIPHAAGNTCPQMGLMCAFNQFSASSSAISHMSGGKGRIGATKLVLFETDGVPNTTVDGGGTFTPASGGTANNCYYTNVTSNDTSPSGYTAKSNAIAVVTRMCSTSVTNSYSSGGRVAKVHAIAFGDLFEVQSTTSAKSALDFLGDIQFAGNTGPAYPPNDGNTPHIGTIESFKIITGTFQNRIDNMRLAYDRIMQGDVQLSVIE